MTRERPEDLAVSRCRTCGDPLGSNAAGTVLPTAITCGDCTAHLRERIPPGGFQRALYVANAIPLHVEIDGPIPIGGPHAPSSFVGGAW